MDLGEGPAAMLQVAMEYIERMDESITVSSIIMASYFTKIDIIMTLS